MPTVLKIGAYRFFFFSGDKDEPKHIHVERENKIAKFWLTPVRLQSSGGFKRDEIALISKLVSDNADVLIGGWDEYFNN